MSGLVVAALVSVAGRQEGIETLRDARRGRLS